MRNLLFIAALSLTGCAAIKSGDVADLATTSYALNAGAHEAGAARICGTNPAAIIGCAIGLKQGAKVFLKAQGYTPDAAGHIISTAGWLGAGSNTAVMAGATLPQGLIVGAVTAMIYHHITTH